ncbi:MAG: helix-turn-helix domain-containing protein [Halanaerobiales bacterium]|nr:helix-turn-helix domain-containing protein [Halanaerobiales bacterium]
MTKLSIREVAEKLGKSESWIKKKIRANELKSKKEGDKYIIDKKELDRFQDKIKGKIDRF